MKARRFLILYIHATLFFSALSNAQTTAACTQVLKGEVRDKVSNELLPNATVVLIDKDGQVVASQLVKDDATFYFEIRCNVEYRLEVSMKEYTAETKSFTTTDEQDMSLRTTVYLDKGKIDFVYDPVSNVKKESIHKSDSTITVGLASVTPKQMAQLPLVKEKIVTEAVEQAPEASAVTKKNQPVAKGKENTPRISPAHKSTLRIAPVYFDLGSSYFTRDGKAALKKLAVLMHEQPEIQIRCVAYSDSQGTPEYNKWLSDRRAMRAVDFLIDQGIDPSRLSSESFGDTRLVNNCTRDVECTDEQHALNRRTEFIIIKK